MLNKPTGLHTQVVPIVQAAVVTVVAQTTPPHIHVEPITIGEQAQVVNNPHAPQCNGELLHVLPISTGEQAQVLPNTIGEHTQVLPIVIGAVAQVLPLNIVPLT